MYSNNLLCKYLIFKGYQQFSRNPDLASNCQITAVCNFIDAILIRFNIKAGQYFADNLFKPIWLNENVTENDISISTRIMGLIKNEPSFAYCLALSTQQATIPISHLASVF